MRTVITASLILLAAVTSALADCVNSSDALCDRQTLAIPVDVRLFRRAVSIADAEMAARRSDKNTSRTRLEPDVAIARKLEALFRRGLVRNIHEIVPTGIFVFESSTAALGSLLRNELRESLKKTFRVGPSLDATVFPTASTVPNDKYFDDQKRGLDKIDAETAWKINTDGSSIVVAIVDTGIDVAHPDLTDNIWHPSTALSAQINGVTVNCSTSAYGYDAIDKNCSPSWVAPHGTNMAGIIGARGNNAIGIAGINWSASMMVVRMFRNVDGLVVGCSSDAIAALEFVEQASKSGVPVKVVNASWGSQTESLEMLAEIDRLMSSGILFMAAAGNCDSDIDTKKFYPASWSSPTRNLLAVTASNYAANDGLFIGAEGSSWGVKTVDIAAPGALTVTTTPGGYGPQFGTSVAAAVVSGAAALVMATCHTDAPATKKLLLDSADTVTGLRTFVRDGKRLNLGAAIQQCSAASPISAAVSH